MFEHALKISVNMCAFPLSVKLGVARFRNGQINPLHQIKMVVSRYLKTVAAPGKLDFTNFASQSKEFFDMEFSLANEGNFDFFCQSIVEQLLGVNMNMLVLNKNHIRHLMPLTHFINYRSLTKISLKNNVITDMTEFGHLSCLRLEAINIQGNPVAAGDAITINEQIMIMLPSVQRTDLSQKAVHELQRVEQVPAVIEEVVRISNLDERFKAEFPQRESVKTFWNRVVIEHNGKIDGCKVLDEMFLHFFEVDPCFPCYYASGENEDSFMLYMNFEPLNILVQNNLRMTFEGDILVTFRLHLKCASFSNDQDNWTELIPKIMAKRLTASKLSLQNLSSDPELKNVIVNLSTNHNLRYVLTCAFNQSPRIEEVDLSHNNLFMLKGLDILKQYSKLVSLDLSNNKIRTLDGFPNNLQLCELKMEQNPVCNKFVEGDRQSPVLYVQSFKKLCPKLQLIDGCKIDQTFKIINFQNYYVHPMAHMAIENFIEFFFRNFDENRQITATAYTERSQLMVTAENEERKHILKQVNILDYYTDLPKTEHDFVTLTIDTPTFYLCPQVCDSIQIIVSGVFRFTHEREKLFTFSRTFLLRKNKTLEGGTGRMKGTLSNTFVFHISNEILVYDVVKDDEIKNRAFKKQPATIGEIESVYAEDTMEQQYQENLQMLKQTILMKPEWCKRLLEEANGDFHKALEHFGKFDKTNFLNDDDFLKF
jgi:hypothetical protein